MANRPAQPATLPEPVKPAPIDALRSLAPFIPPPRPTEIDLFLDSNEGPPHWAEMLPSIAALTTESLRCYPTPPGGSHTQPLVDAVGGWAKLLGTTPDSILITAGGDEAIDRTCRAYLGPGREIILPVPTFEMLGHYPTLVGAGTIEVPWPPGEPYPIDQVLSHLSPRTSIIAVVSPNNPTGAIATPDDLRRLSASAPGTLILVDQAYTEFAEIDLTPIALELPNTIVIRTLSKAWGLAGLRIGCAIGNPELIRPLRAAGGPFTVSAPSLALATAAISHSFSGAYGRKDLPGPPPRYLARIARERVHLVDLLNKAPGAEAWPSQGNFVLARFTDAAAVHSELYRRGISVRQMKPRWQAWSLDQCIRITCPGDMIAFSRLTDALIEVLYSPAALRRSA